MKKVQNLLYLSFLAVVITTMCFFITSFTGYTNKVEFDYFKHAFYRTKDNSGFISFGSFKNTVICLNDSYYFIDNVDYDNGIFKMQNRDNEEVYKIGVVEQDIIYCSDFNTYFYNNSLFSEV